MRGKKIIGILCGLLLGVSLLALAAWRLLPAGFLPSSPSPIFPERRKPPASTPSLRQFEEKTSSQQLEQLEAEIDQLLEDLEALEEEPQIEWEF